MIRCAKISASMPGPLAALYRAPTGATVGGDPQRRNAAYPASLIQRPPRPVRPTAKDDIARLAGYQQHRKPARWQRRRSAARATAVSSPSPAMTPGYYRSSMDTPVSTTLPMCWHCVWPRFRCPELCPSACLPSTSTIRCGTPTRPLRGPNRSPTTGSAATVRKRRPFILDAIREYRQQIAGNAIPSWPSGCLNCAKKCCAGCFCKADWSANRQP